MPKNPVENDDMHRSSLQNQLDDMFLNQLGE